MSTCSSVELPKVELLYDKVGGGEIVFVDEVVPNKLLAFG